MPKIDGILESVQVRLLLSSARCFRVRYGYFNVQDGYFNNASASAVWVLTLVASTGSQTGIPTEAAESNGNRQAAANRTRHTKVERKSVDN